MLEVRRGQARDIANLAPKICFLGLQKKVGHKVSKATSDWKGLEVTV